MSPSVARRFVTALAVWLALVLPSNRAEASCPSKPAECDNSQLWLMGWQHCMMTEGTDIEDICFEYVGEGQGCFQFEQFVCYDGDPETGCAQEGLIGCYS